MKQFLSFLILLLTLSACDSCQERPLNSKTVKVLCIGDSRVKGNPPLYHSYRYPLWKLAAEKDIWIDFLGSSEDKFSYSNYNDYCFDNDHESYAGLISTNLLQIIEHLELKETPDYIFLTIGGNDLIKNANTVEGIIRNIDNILLTLNSKFPNSVILIDKLAPAKSNSITIQGERLLNNLNLGIEILIDSKNSNQFKLVDLTLNWKDEYLADNIHYSLQGAEYVASQYIKFIK